MVVITEEQARAKEIDIETGRPPFTQKHSGEMNGLAAHLVRGTAVGGMAHPRPLRSGRLGSRGADIGTRRVRHRGRLAVLRPRHIRVVLEPHR
jgi:hypothetical protein